MDQGYKTHFTEHVQRIVAAGSVGADGYVDACICKITDRRKSIAKLRVRSRIRDDSRPAARNNVDVIILHLDTVGKDRVVTQEPKVIQVSDRCLSVLLPAIIHLIKAFGQMRLAQHPALLRFLNDLSEKLRPAAVDRVRRENELQQVTLIFFHLIDGLGKTAPAIRIQVLSDQTSSDIAADTRFARRPTGLLGEHMHVDKAGRAGAQHLHHGKKVGPVSAFLRQCVLDGHDSFKEPLFKVNVVGIVSHDSHVRMCVHIDEAGHDKAAACIDDLKVIGSLVRGEPDRITNYVNISLFDGQDTVLISHDLPAGNLVIHKNLFALCRFSYISQPSTYSIEGFPSILACGAYILIMF